jgi:hypothetical protein
LLHLRDAYSEKAQEKPILGEKNNKYHKGWFWGIINDLDLIIEEGCIQNDGVLQSIREFQQYVADNVRGTQRITRENIDRGNEILNLVIEYLS